MNSIDRSLTVWTILALFTLIHGQALVRPQTLPGKRPFDQAVRLERLQQFDQAEEIYRELLKRNPRDTRTYLQLKSLLRKRGKFPDLQALIEERLRSFPSDLQSYVELGEAFLNQGEKEKALAHWDNALALYPRSKTFYRLLMQMYIQYQFDEQLDDLVERGRNIFHDPSLFSLDLGNIYFHRHDYGKAADEFITFAIFHPERMRTASAQLLRMSDQEGSEHPLEQKLTARIAENEKVVRTLYSDFLFKIGRYEDAFQQHVALGVRTDEDLDRWLQFANSLRKENELSLALETFTVILEGIPHQGENGGTARIRKLAGEALYGLALTYEKQIIPGEDFHSLAGYFSNNVFFEDPFYGLPTVQVKPLEETFALYDSILVSLPSTTLSPQAHFRLGEIKYRITRDFDGALDSYQSAEALSSSGKFTRKVRARIGDVLMAKGDYPGALSFFDRQLETVTSEEDRKLFLLKKCQVLLLSGDVDSTLSHLGGLIGFLDITDDYFNDALELKGFIEENYLRTSPEGKEAFRMYLKGESFLKQAKLSEARSLFRELARLYPGAPIADEAAFRQAKMDVIFGNYEEALFEFESLQATPMGDRATVMMGELYDHYLNDKQEASRWYLKVLEEYSGSMLAEPIRYRIREISKERSLD
ncbi:MAG: tetratricopeptide repeat protein [Fidelibacterota bacterium]